MTLYKSCKYCNKIYSYITNRNNHELTCDANITMNKNYTNYTNDKNNVVYNDIMNTKNTTNQMNINNQRYKHEIHYCPI